MKVWHIPVALVGAALLLGGIAYWRNIDTSACRKQLDADLHAFESEPARTPLVPMRAGKFSQSMTEVVSKLGNPSAYECNKTPPSEACLQLLDDKRAVFEPLFGLPHLTEHGAPRPRFGEHVIELLNGAKLAAADTLVEATDGNPHDAAEHCVELIALGRDAALRATLLRRMVGLAIQEHALPACRVALGKLHDSERHFFAEKLRTIRAEMPPWSETMRAESLLGQLSLIDAIDAKAQEEPVGAWQRVLLRHYWPRIQARWAEVIAVADRPAELAALLHRASAAEYNDLLRGLYPRADALLHHVERGDKQLAALDELIAENAR
jgi:hypothetical protein